MAEERFALACKRIEKQVTLNAVIVGSIADHQLPSMAQFEYTMWKTMWPP